MKLTYEEFQELEELVEEARKGLHHDVLYAWSKLIACHAFQVEVNFYLNLFSQAYGKEEMFTK